LGFPEIEEKFKVLLDMRDFVLKALDEQRKAGKIGSGLQAKVVINSQMIRFFINISVLLKIWHRFLLFLRLN
jgi:hypothetical protein